MSRQPSIIPLVFACVSFVTLGVGCGGSAKCADAPSSPGTAEPSASATPSGENTLAPSPVLGPTSPAAPSAATPAPAPATTGSTSAEPAPSANAVQPASPPAGEGTDPKEAALAARASGPATGGPRGTRPCAFHESVDTYQRQCVSTVNADGSVSVSAKGTKLNPDNGFEFTMHGGENNQWVAKGTLNAFKHCTGAFVAPVTMSVDHGVKTYDLRFKEHCMIVVR